MMMMICACHGQQVGQARHVVKVQHKAGCNMQQTYVSSWVGIAMTRILFTEKVMMNFWEAQLNDN